MVNIRHDDFGTAAPAGSDKIFFRDVDDFSGLPNGGIGVTTVDQMFDAILALKGAEIKAAYEGQANTNAFTDAAATVVTEALTDSDFVGATGGLLLKDGAGSYNVARVNLAATGAPGTGNDDTQGYEITSQWYDQTNDDLYVCFDASTGAAQWELVNGAGGGGGGGSFTEKALEDLMEGKTPAAPAAADEFLFRDVSATDTVGVATPQQIVETAHTAMGIEPQNRISTTTDPGVNDDGAGTNGVNHLVNDLWTNTSTDNSWICQDITTGAAVWTQIDGAAATDQVFHLNFDLPSGTTTQTRKCTTCIPVTGTITDIRLNHNRTIGASGTDYWTIQVNNRTKSVDHLAAPFNTGVAGLTDGVVEDLGTVANTSVDKFDTVQVVMTAVGAPTNFFSDPASLIVTVTPA